MDVLEAHALLAIHGDRDSLEDVYPGLKQCPPWPAFATAAASLSGMLEDCETADDLADAVGHFKALLNIHRVDWNQWWHETARVVDAVVEYGQQVMDSMGGMHALN